MSVKTKYAAENELRYNVPISVLNNLAVTGVIREIKSEAIEQIWVSQGLTPNGIKVRSRIRKITSINGRIPYECTYDTKYDLTPTKRIELSAPLGFDEYELLKTFYPDAEQVNKRRLLFTDNIYHYEVDIYPGNPIAAVEIEFKTAQEMESFIAPAWLAPYKEKPNADRR